jgi:hypothetical protein
MVEKFYVVDKVFQASSFFKSSFENHGVIPKQEISLHTPFPNPLPQGERELHEFSLYEEKGEGKSDCVNLFNPFAIVR